MIFPKIFMSQKNTFWSKRVGKMHGKYLALLSANEAINLWITLSLGTKRRFYKDCAPNELIKLAD